MHADDDEVRPARSAASRPLLFAAIALLILLAFVLLLRYLLRVPDAEHAVLPQAEAPAQNAPEAVESKGATPPAADAGASTSASEPPLPELEHSDPEVRASLSDILPAAAQPSLQPNDVLRRAVAIADAFARGKVLRDKLPLPVVGGKLMTLRRENRIFLSTENHARYNGVVDAFAELDTEAVARWFNRYEPLLRKAYLELGKGDGDVRTLLLSGIDLMLNAPEAPAEIELVQPSVFYKFADPALEALPDSAKLLLRIGPRNRAIVVERLQRLRRELARP